MEKIKVLVVDDDDIVRTTLEDILIKFGGCETYTASNGKDGIREIQERDFDVVFTDLAMPEMNGIDFIKEVKKINPKLPIVMLTGYGCIDNAVNAMKEGAIDFLTKPVSIENLLSILNRISVEPKLLKDIGEGGAYKFDHLNLALYKKYKSICTLQEVSAELDELYDNKKIYEKVVELSNKLLSTKASALFFLRKNNIEIKTSNGFRAYLDHSEDAFLEELKIKINELSKLTNPDLSHSMLNNQILLMPLTLNNEFFGGILFLNKIDGSSFNEEDFALATTFTKKISLRIENNALYEVFYNNLVNTLKSLIISIEARDSYTKQHSERVTLFSLQIAEVMGLDEEEIDVLRFGGYLHDIGKIGVKDTVLLKPGKLTDEEFEEIKQHSIIGDNILKPIKFFPKERKMIRHHHERYDGNGYPDNLAKNDIPITARILAVADTYDAMTSTRPYRKALDHKTAVEELKRCSGGQFDPEVVKAFLETEVGKTGVIK